MAKSGENVQNVYKIVLKCAGTSRGSINLNFFSFFHTYPYATFKICPIKIGLKIRFSHRPNVYVRIVKDCQYSWNIEDFPKYYSDHDSIGLTLWKKTDAAQ